MTPNTDWTPIGMSVARLQVARIGRLHNVCAEIRLAFAMGTHVHFAAVVGRTAYSNNMPEVVRPYPVRAVSGRVTSFAAAARTLVRTNARLFAHS